MKKLILGLMLSVFLVGCGQDPNPPSDETFTGIRGIIKNTFPALMGQVDKLDVDKLPQQFQNLYEMGVLSAEDADKLLDPYNQQVLMDVLRLIKGGKNAKADQETMVRLTAAAGPCDIIGVLKTISTILQAAAPFLAAINPAIAGVVQIVANVLPVAIEVISQIFSCTVASYGALSIITA